MESEGHAAKPQEGGKISFLDLYFHRGHKKEKKKKKRGKNEEEIVAKVTVKKKKKKKNLCYTESILEGGNAEKKRERKTNAGVGSPLGKKEGKDGEAGSG